MVLSELDFVVFDGLVERFVLASAFFDVMDDLKEVDGDGEDLSACLEDLLIFFDYCSVLFLDGDLVFAFGCWTTHKLL
jgi:hypothetical protein